MAPRKALWWTASDYRDGEDDLLDDLHTTSVFASLSKLYLSETYSDMKIECAGETFHAHRAVVCPQSPFFDRALSGGFQVLRRLPLVSFSALPCQAHLT